MGDAPLIVDLAALGRTDLPLAGGKGANLGELMRAGLPVPPGFVVTTAAFDLVAARGASREALLRVELPPPLSMQIVGAWRSLGAPPVAVRSSATAEDLPNATFAGQQDTFLNVVAEDALLDAVRRCWASLFGERARRYREHHGLDGAWVKLAVVVQRLVQADYAGVMFSANPVTGARDEVVIDASPGLGEAVVSGLVTPDHLVVRGRRIVQRLRGRREVQIRARPGGGTEEVIGPSAPPLPDRVPRALAALGRRIERHFGAPQDVEWVYARGELFIVQARPITALPEPRPANRRARLVAAMVGEMVPVRPYPLDVDAWLPSLFGAVKPMFSALGLKAEPLHFFTIEDGVVSGLSDAAPLSLTPGVLLAPLRLLWLALRYDPRRFREDPLLARALAKAREREALRLEALEWPALLAAFEEALALPAQAAGDLRRRFFPRAAFASGALALLLALVGRPGRLGALLSGTESLTTQANEALEGLAATVRAEPELLDLFARTDARRLRGALEGTASGRAFLQKLQSFLEEHGHREAVISTALEPTWKDAPEAVLGLIKGLALARPPSGKPPPEWQQVRDELLAGSALRRPPLRGAFLSLLGLARRFFQLREDTHYWATRALPMLRRIALELGRRLVAQGALERAEDVFHLRLAELAESPRTPGQADALREAVARRRARRLELGEGPVADLRALQTSARLPGLLASGSAGSPGVARGPVRVVLSSAEFGKVQPGDVLVAPFTNPGWTPLFQHVAAVVVDTGSSASHAAIVAREYGIPAVMGTGDGTTRRQDGQPVKVDGDRGLVLIDPAR